MDELKSHLMTNVDKSASTGCWLWAGSFAHNGYGKYQSRYTHVLMYELTHGPVPKGMKVDHKCHQVLCVNPAHLRVVTNKQNMENRAGAQSNSKSGIRGVSWHKQHKKWRAVARHHGKHYEAGYFDNIEDAEKAAIALRKRLFTHAQD